MIDRMARLAKSGMKIVADENIPAVAEAFGTLGSVTRVNGRAMTAEQVRAADILLVRSVTRVDQNLLAGSKVRFVASATIGFDHVDRDYLASRAIGFATAPGSNAISAAEYVVSALLVLAERGGFTLAGKTVGIIGCGNVGSRVRQRLEVLGMRCLVNDPPREAAGVADDYVDLATALQADIVTVHVPYMRSGMHATHHLFNAQAIGQLQPGSIFINTSRGAVTDNVALLAALQARDDLTVVLDVWEGEPSISLSLLERVALGTPHIAGYSLDGKLRGTGMIYRACCDYLGAACEWDVSRVLPLAQPVHLPTGADCSAAVFLQAAVLGCYDIRDDDVRLRKLFELPADQRAGYFDRLRKEYPIRREFAATPLRVTSLDAQQRQLLLGLGFRL